MGKAPKPATSQRAPTMKYIAIAAAVIWAVYHGLHYFATSLAVGLGL